MGSCEFEKEGWKCPLDAEEGSDYCEWHKVVAGKFANETVLRMIRGKKFIGAYLELANLNYCCAGALSFREADLVKAKLKSSNCASSIFDDARLNGIELKKSVLSNASFKRSNMRSAILNDAIVDYATLNYANLSYVDMRGADLHNELISKLPSQLFPTQQETRNI